MTRVVKRFINASFENYQCDTDEQKRLVSELKRGLETGFSRNIIILGGVGTGKTHLAYAILNSIAEKISSLDGTFQWYGEKNVIFRPIKTVIDDIRASWKDENISNPIPELSSVPLLILDEVGMQYGTPSERTELYELFNRRYEDMLPIIAISNNSQKELRHILGQRIYDRLVGGASIYEIRGKSKR